MDERRRFLLLWKSLDQRKRWDVRRHAWSGRQAPDPETAWLVKMFTEPWARLAGLFVAVGGALLLIALGTATIVVIRNHGADVPFASAVAVLQIISGLLSLALLARYRRTHRVNDPVAVPPGG